MVRYLKYDVLRVISTLMVLLIHASAYFVIMLEMPGCSSEPAYIVANVLDGLGRSAVPVFVMLSGALLLNEEKKFDAKTFYKRSFLTMLVTLIFWLVVYGVFYSQVLPYDTDFLSFFLCFKGSNCPHLWYLYLVLMIYLSVPLLRLFVKKENGRIIGFTILVCLGLSLLSSVVSLISRLSDINAYVGSFHLEKYTNFISFILGGWYLSNFKPDPKMKKVVYVLGGLSLIAIVTVVWFQFEITGEGFLRDYVSESFALPAAFYGFAVFMLVSDICGTKETKSRAVRKLSELSFGIYIMHIFFYEWFVCFIHPFDAESESAFVYILVLWAFMLIMSVISSLILSKIKYVRKLIHIR